MEYLAKLSTKLQKEELELISKKYEAPQIRNLQDAEILANTAICLKRIHIITGWNLPDDIEYIKSLTDELYLKLKESFEMLNFPEITAAFRKNGIGVKDWGKNMNLDLICTVLAGYCDERRNASFAEERANDKPKEVILTDEDLLNISRRDIEIAYQQMRNGRVPVMLDSFAETMILDGFIEKPEERDLFFTYCLGQGRLNIYKKES